MSIQDPRAAMVAYNQTFRLRRTTISHFVGRRVKKRPLAYTVDTIVIVAWFLNIEANPIVTVEVGTERY